MKEESLSPRWRYVTAGWVTIDTPVARLRLLSAKALNTNKAFRFAVPGDMNMCKHPYENHYYCVYDTRTLRRLGAVPVVRIAGRWRQIPELSDMAISDWHQALVDLGYKVVSDMTVGYLTPEAYDDYVLRHGAGT